LNFLNLRKLDFKTQMERNIYESNFPEACFLKRLKRIMVGDFDFNKSLKVRYWFSWRNMNMTSFAYIQNKKWMRKMEFFWGIKILKTFNYKSFSKMFTGYKISNFTANENIVFLLTKGKFLKIALKKVVENILYQEVCLLINRRFELGHFRTISTL